MIVEHLSRFAETASALFGLKVTQSTETGCTSRRVEAQAARLLQKNTALAHSNTKLPGILSTCAAGQALKVPTFAVQLHRCSVTCFSKIALFLRYRGHLTIS